MNLQLRRIRLAFLSIWLMQWLSFAQSSGKDPDPNQSQAPEGWSNGGYLIHQSIEAGYRVSETLGSTEMYRTLVNLQTGPRILDQTLSMHSTTHESVLFDNLSINSFGWGGDPNNALRARFDNKWYDFRSSFVRGQNYFDYNLLANPLNPPTSSPSVPILFSPHNFSTTRRMTDVDLTLLPLSRVSFRLGYSRNNMTGSSGSTLNNGAVGLLYQPWNTTLNSYRFGVDYKFLPRTVISYDQFLDYYKGDTSWQLAPYVSALLPGASGSVALGLPFNTVGGTPCAPPAGQPLIDSTGTLTNLACNGYLSYNRSNIVRTSMPTERISLHSNYFERLELNASYAYSSADMNAPLDEFFNGLVSRNEIRQSTDIGSAEAKRISNVADAGVTFHFTKRLRLVDTFRFWSYRIPGNFNLTETDWIVPTASGSCTAPTCTLLTPISSTVPSVSTTFDQLSFNQNWKRNEVNLIWDASKRFGGRVGFRYDDRAFTQLDLTTGDQTHIPIHGYTALLGFWVRPVSNLRFNFDWEDTNNDNSIVLIGSRKEARYRIRASYTPRPWVVVGTSVNLWENSNRNAFTDYRGHNRNYGFTASLSPREYFGVDLAFNYSDYLQNAFICFNNADTSLPVVANAGSCTANGYNDSRNPLLTYGFYTNQTYYGLGAVMFRPIRRVTFQLGYSITSVGGDTPQFNILQPFGSLRYNYHQPLANFAIDLGHNVTAKVGWNYYQYGEGSFVGPTDPRYFRANNTTVALRWAF